MTLLSEMSLHNMTNVPPVTSTEIRDSEEWSPGPGHNIQYWPVLPNTPQFLTISKVISSFTVAHWPRREEVPSPSWMKVMETSCGWTHWKCLACAAIRLAPAPQAAEYEMPSTMMPISILDVMQFTERGQVIIGHHL